MAMSAPHTNLAEEGRHHCGPLIGMLLVVLFVFAILLYRLWHEFSLGSAPAGDSGPRSSSSVEAADTGALATAVDPLTNQNAPLRKAPAPYPADE
jgi:hypothetical protein